MAVILLRLRRVAILAAAVLFLWAAFLSGGGTLVYATVEAYLFVPLGLEIVALAASPGPRRGLQILTWKHGALAVIVTLVVSATSYPAAVIVIAVICAAMALASSLGRWLVVLLAVAAWPFFFGGPLAYLGPFSGPGFRIALAYLPPGLALIAWTYLPPLVLLVLAVIAARRESLRPASFPPASG
jgi:hypothetical protein